MKTLGFPLFICAVAILGSCRDHFDETRVLPLPESTTAITGLAVLKALPLPGGWITLNEILQPQYLITQPKREISWMDGDFTEISNYKPAEGWALLDAVVHPSGH